MNNMFRIATILLILPVLGHVGGYVPAAWEHVVDPNWPDHGRFHAFQSVVWAVGWNLLTVWIILRPLQRREGWTRWALLAYGLAMQIGYFISIAAIPEGTPPELIFNVLYAISALMFALGLALAWRALSTAPA